MAKAAIWINTDAEARKRGEQTGLDTLVVHAFVHERQCWPRRLPSPSVFLQISTHFTATPGIPPSSATLQPRSFERNSQVKLGAFTLDLRGRLRTLYAQ